VNKVDVDLRFGGQRIGRQARLLPMERLMHAAGPAAAIFLIGSLLLGITTFLAWDLHAPVMRDSSGGSRIVDDMGVFGRPGALVQLDAYQTDAYLAARVAQHRHDLLLCVGIGLLGLAVGSILIVRHEARDAPWRVNRPSRL